MYTKQTTRTYLSVEDYPPRNDRRHAIVCESGKLLPVI